MVPDAAVMVPLINTLPDELNKKFEDDICKNPAEPDKYVVFLSPKKNLLELRIIPFKVEYCTLLPDALPNKNSPLPLKNTPLPLIKLLGGGVPREINPPFAELIVTLRPGSVNIEPVTVQPLSNPLLDDIVPFTIKPVFVRYIFEEEIYNIPPVEPDIYA